MRIPDWAGCNGPDELNCYPTKPQPIEVRGRGDWELTPVVGVRYGPLDLSVRNIQTHGDPYPALPHGLTWNLSFTLRQ